MFQSTPNRWLMGGRPESTASIRLFAFTHAGGCASGFRQWHKMLPSNIDFYAVQLPGRENRFNEPKLTQFSAAIEAITDALRPNINIPFAFFGHSLGALLAFETTRYLRQLGAPTPQHLFLSGSSAPQVRDAIEAYSKLSDAAFVQSISRYDGIPVEVSQNSELMALFLPTLRADFSLLETYQYREEAPLNCPISVFGGLGDLEASQAKLATWNIHTTKAFRMQMFPGNHFYLNTVQTALLTEITRAL